MHVVELLHARSAKYLREIHSKRLNAVWAGVEALLRGERLWLTALGRHVRGPAKEKHSIKRMDRLLGNRYLKGERIKWYRWIARLVLGEARQPVVLVDWSDVDNQGKLHVLRAAVAVGGRALPIYELVHERLHNVEAQKRFLKQLSAVLGCGCKPILVSDAGFRCEWFIQVEKMGWYYVGRVRNNELVRWPSGGVWFSNKVLLERAKTRAQSLGALWIRRRGPKLMHFYVYKAKPKGRVKLTRFGQRMRRAHSQKHERREREPWLLASNLDINSTVAERAVAIYKTRMQIEEGFRDLKSPRYGFGLRENLGRDVERVSNLLLLGALGVLATWLMGLHGYAQQLHKGLQANTVHDRRVLSTFYVGRRLIAKQLALSREHLGQALKQLRTDVIAQDVV